MPLHSRRRRLRQSVVVLALAVTAAGCSPGPADRQTARPSAAEPAAVGSAPTRVDPVATAALRSPAPIPAPQVSTGTIVITRTTSAPTTATSTPTPTSTPPADPSPTTPTAGPTSAPPPAAATAPPPQPTRPRTSQAPPPADTVITGRIMDRINGYRTARELPALEASGCADASALAHARAQAAQHRMFHRTIAQISGACSLSGGENVAYGYRSLDEVIDAWWHSPGHHRNILDERYRYMGAAVAYAADGTAYYTQVFYFPD